MQQKSFWPEKWLLPDLGGICINTKERRNYFRNFELEVLTSNIINKESIKKFISKKNNNSLEEYLLNENKAWLEDSEGETKVYLIKDKLGDIALFFSIKCGLLVGENEDEQLSAEYREFIDTVIKYKKSKDDGGLEGLYDVGTSLYKEDVDKLFKIADRRLERKIESAEIGQSENTINVPNCYSAIEFRHFCKNENFKIPDNLGVPLGFGLFWEIIVPLVETIAKQVGCKYIYLFAADNSDMNSKDLKGLVSYYKNALKFTECDASIKFVKPEYDNYCYGLVQEVSKLESNRKAVWNEFSDV